MYISFKERNGFNIKESNLLKCFKILIIFTFVASIECQKF